jgi:hypothetical protein
LLVCQIETEMCTDVLGLDKEILQQESEYPSLNFTCYLRLFPLKCYKPNHKCFHRLCNSGTCVCLNVHSYPHMGHAHCEDKSDDVKDSFCEELGHFLSVS